MTVWGIPYTDDARVIFNHLSRIINVCAAFGLTVSKAKTEIMCLHTRGVHGKPDAASVSKPSKLKIRMLKAKPLETMLYGCVI